MIFGWYGIFFALDTEILLLSTTIIHHAVQLTAKWELIHATDRNFCFTSREI